MGSHEAFLKRVETRRNKSIGENGFKLIWVWEMELRIDALVAADHRPPVVHRLRHCGGVLVEKLWSCGHAKPEFKGLSLFLVFPLSRAGILSL